MKNNSILVLGVIFGFLFQISCNKSKLSKNRDWPVYLGDKSNSHYSPLSQIDTSNVKQLEKAWIYHTGDADTISNSQMECNPIMVNGTLYGTSPKLKLFAIDAATGEQKWIFDPFSDTSKTSVQINVNRGVTYWSAGDDSRIFYAAGSFLYCINAETGIPITSFGDKGKVSLHDGLGRDVDRLYVASTSPGIIYKNILIVGTRVAETNPAAPGDVRAYDVHTGKMKWVFHTIPRPGEKGNESWEDSNAWKYTGGVNCWAGMAIDENKGILYVPLGSATYDFYGGLRKGKNLFSDCLVALDASSGELLWYFQTVHHDLWDRDLPAPPNLVTIEHGGKKINAVVQITKTGFVFVFDRKNGHPVFPIHEMAVPDSPALSGEEPWPTQPVPELPKPFTSQRLTTANINDLVPDLSQKKVRAQLERLEPAVNMFLPPSERGTVIFPGFDGGGEWGGAAFDPQSGLLYVNANQVPWSLTMVKKASENQGWQQTLGAHGRDVYLQNCMACHGKEREGSGNYPSLVHLERKYSKDQVLDIINNGRRMMPAFKHISNDEKEALISYLLDLKDKKQQFVGNRNDSTTLLMPYTMTGYKKIRTPEGYPANKPPWGTLTAVNLNSGEQVWQIPLGEYPELTRKGIPITGTENYGGPVVTAGGLLIIAATPDKKIRIFNKRNGKLLWESLLPAAGFATPATYMLNGKQYIVIACGGGKLDAASGDAYVAFALP